MTQAELIRFLENLGAEVFIRRLNPDEGETVSVLVERIPEEETPIDIPGWKHALYLLEDNDGWTIHYHQTGRTRPLQDSELKQLLTEWVQQRDYQIFRKYEPD
ncbi:hypothetical protein [Gimesia sp.]|uniref:hypothetical protein n=1 Tax=Gimesia sp. TaxID=2024833 RepID=UPI003A91BB5F